MKIKKTVIVLLLILFLVLGWFLGSFLKYKGLYNQEIGLTVFSCQDGCAIATRNLTGDGFLNNFTWACMDQCAKYVKEVACSPWS